MKQEKSEYQTLVDLSAEIRDLIYEDANDMMLGAMVGSPVECLGFAIEWIKRDLGMDYNKKLFKRINYGK